MLAGSAPADAHPVTTATPLGSRYEQLVGCTRQVLHILRSYRLVLVQMHN
jgi:hypothetical protein